MNPMSTERRTPPLALLAQYPNIKPCNYGCGRDDLRVRKGRGKIFHVECTACGARGPIQTRIGWNESVQEAVEAWGQIDPDKIRFSFEPAEPHNTYVLLSQSAQQLLPRTLFCAFNFESFDGAEVRRRIEQALNMDAS